MKKLLLIVAAGGLTLGALLLVIAVIANGGRLDFNHDGMGFAGDKPIGQTANSKSWAADGDEIEIHVPARIHYQPGGNAMIRVTASPDAIKNLAYGNGKLGYSTPLLMGSDGAIDVTITGALNKISVAGSGKIDLGEIHQQRLSLAIRGSGTVDGAGTVDDLDLAIAGSGRMRLASLVAKKLNVSIAGSGSIDTAATDSADVSIAGSGTVRFHVKPKSVSSHIAGSGNIVDAVDEKD